MATLTLLTVRNMIRNRFNDQSTAIFSDAFLNLLINDGYKDVSIKGVAYERRLSYLNIIASSNIVYLPGTVVTHIIRPNFVTYSTGSGEIGLVKILPHALGHIPTQGNYPQFWFPWGECIVIDPAPDVATYDLFVYSAVFPSAVLTSDTATFTNLPPEFHECVYEYAAAMCNLKLRLWANFISDYNDYISEVQRRKSEYIIKNPDLMVMRNIPDTVEVSYGEQPVA